MVKRTINTRFTSMVTNANRMFRQWHSRKTLVVGNGCLTDAASGTKLTLSFRKSFTKIVYV